MMSLEPLLASAEDPSFYVLRSSHHLLGLINQEISTGEWSQQKVLTV